MNNKKLISEFEAKYQELAATIEAAQEKIRTESQALVAELFKDFFAKHGENVYAVHWTQYTPYFNDGEECTFGVNEIYLSFTEEGYEDGEGDASIFSHEDTYREHLAKWEAYEADPVAAYKAYYDDFIKKYSSNSYSYYKPEPFERYKPSYYDKEELLEKIELIESRQDLLEVIEDFEALERVINSIEDSYMEMIYGDHVKVTYFGPDGELVVDEYSHD